MKINIDLNTGKVRKNQGMIVRTPSGSLGILLWDEPFKIKDEKHKHKVVIRELDEDWKETGRKLMCREDKLECVGLID